MFFRVSLTLSLISVGVALHSGCASRGAATKPNASELVAGGSGDTASGADGGGPSSATAREASKDGGPTVGDGGAVVSGYLDPAVVRANVRRQQAAFRSCYEAGLRTNAKLRGKVLARLLIAPDGHVAQAVDAGSDLGDPATVDCVLSVYRRLVFPPPQGGALSIVYPMLLDSDAAADAGAVSIPTPGRLAELVRTLGTTTADPFTTGVFDELRSVPLAAARSLIQELRVLSPDASGSALQHVVWCIRALRVLTAQDFRFPTKLSLTPSQREIYEGAGNELAFFRVRMSNGKLSVAPRDVQQQVLFAWQEWLHEHGDGFAVPERGVEFIDWYF